MSMPILYCRFVKAYDNKKLLKALAHDLIKNFKMGHFTFLPCEHNPPCRKLSEKEMDQLIERLEKEAEKSEGEQ